MRKLVLSGLAAALMVAALPIATASAQGYYWRGPGYYGGHYYGHYWGDDGVGVGLGLGAGLLAGAAIAGAANAGPAPAGGVAYSYPPNTRLGYCERHLPGFDVGSGTYVSQSGRRARCP